MPLCDLHHLYRHHHCVVLCGEPSKSLGLLGVHDRVLCELDEDEVVERGQVLLVGLVLDRALIVDVGQEQGVVSVLLLSQGVMPVLGLENIDN